MLFSYLFWQNWWVGASHGVLPDPGSWDSKHAKELSSLTGQRRSGVPSDPREPLRAGQAGPEPTLHPGGVAKARGTLTGDPSIPTPMSGGAEFSLTSSPSGALRRWGSHSELLEEGERGSEGPGLSQEGHQPTCQTVLQQPWDCRPSCCYDDHAHPPRQTVAGQKTGVRDFVFPCAFFLLVPWPRTRRLD